MNSGDKFERWTWGPGRGPQVWISERSEALWGLLQMRLELEGYRAVRHDGLRAIEESLQFAGEPPRLVLHGMEEETDDWRADVALIAAISNRVRVVAMVNDFEREFAARLKIAGVRVLMRPFWYHDLHAELQLADLRSALAAAR
jgi:hypothetical protein